MTLAGVSGRKRGIPDNEASIAMANHFGVVVEALRRVECALAYHAAKLADSQAVPPSARMTGPVRLAKEPELAAWYSPHELGELASNLRACIQRHHMAMVSRGGGLDTHRPAAQQFPTLPNNSASHRVISQLLGKAAPTGRPEQVGRVETTLHLQAESPRPACMRSRRFGPGLVNRSASRASDALVSRAKRAQDSRPRPLWK